MSVTISIELDIRRLKQKSNSYPVKLRVTSNREPRRYQTVYDLTQNEFDNLSATRVSDKMQKVRNCLKQMQREAGNAADKIIPFNFEDFEKEYILNNSLFRQRKYIRKAPEVKNVTEDFDYSEYFKKFPILTQQFEIGTIGYTYFRYIQMLIRMGRIGTASSYQNSYLSLKEFGGNTIFATVTVEYLRKYELWMKTNGKSKSTVGIYLRALSAMFNEADDKRIIRKEKCYPFGKKKYIIPSPRKIKKALTIDYVGKIYNYAPSCEGERKARDYWLFLYFCNGMNTKDMILLKYKNIQDGFIVFERAKTEWTIRNDSLPISVYITEEIQEIIDKWGNKDKNPENYIFPVLEAGLTPLREHDLKQQFTHFINDWMEVIRKNLGIEKKASTVVARHTFATVMKQSGASMEYIKESLGHQQQKTTENYTGSFENEIKKEFSSKLAAFKKTIDHEKEISNVIAK